MEGWGRRGMWEENSLQNLKTYKNNQTPSITDPMKQKMDSKTNQLID